MEENPEIAAKYSVKSIPAVFFIKDSNVVDQFTGVQSTTEINKRIDLLISDKIENPEQKS